MSAICPYRLHRYDVQLRWYEQWWWREKPLLLRTDADIRLHRYLKNMRKDLATVRSYLYTEYSGSIGEEIWETLPYLFVLIRSFHKKQIKERR